MNLKNIFTIISIFAYLNIFSQINLGLVQANATVSGTNVSVTYSTINSIPAGFINPLNILFKVPIANAGTANFNITSNPLGLVTAFDFDGGDGFQYFMFQSLTAINTATWPHPSTIPIGVFNITGTPNAVLTTFGQFGNFWNGTAANLGDDNLVQWPVSINLVLPIKIKTFSVEKAGERSSKLNWITSSEINSAYFGIERSTDGDNWESIGFVKAAGNSNVDLYYQYIDSELPLNRNNATIFYYRLMLVDLDGQYKYSDVRGINFRHTFTGFVTVYPNPTTDRINVDLTGLDLEDGKIGLSVYDMNGSRLINKNIIGNGIELIDVNNLPSGTYNVIVQQGNNKYQQKIIKVD